MSRYPLRQTIARILSREDRLLTYGVAPRKGRSLEVGERSKSRKTTKMGEVEWLPSQPRVPQPLRIQTPIGIVPISTIGDLHEPIESGQISFPLGEKRPKWRTRAVHRTGNRGRENSLSDRVKRYLTYRNSTGIGAFYHRGSKWDVSTRHC